ncbi:MAG: SipW-dependent-type signal peptide-containing protein [Patescibacteria group bacterium]|nr:SipW-dependent-type signal peptide-containing protein [Patescibacteria group bacterium]
MFTKIAKSLVVIIAVAALTVGATSAIFTSQATVTGNTFATGVLEIRINGQASIPGFNVTNAIPGTSQEGQFGVNNYGAPWFAGPSTLAAKTLKISAVKTGGSTYLYDKLEIIVEANRGWATWMPVYSGPLSGLSDGDLLNGRWADLAAGNSEDVRYTVSLPASADDSYQGLSTTFDFVVTATSS